MKQSRLQQNSYHAILREIAFAKGVPEQAAKMFMVAKFKEECAGDNHLEALWAGVDDRTRDFPRALACAFTDYLLSWQGENCDKSGT